MNSKLKTQNCATRNNSKLKIRNSLWQESLLLMSLRASAASMATVQTTTSPPTHQVTKSTSPSSPTHTRDLPPKSSWNSARSLQASCLHRMAQRQPPKREERTEGHRRLSARTEAKTCLRLLQHQPGNLQIHGR